MSITVPGRVAEGLRRSTVTVRSGGRDHAGGGSGVALTNDRVVTNAHVLQGGGVTVESWEGKSVSAQVVRVDRARDLAMLAAVGLDAPAVQFGDSDEVHAGVPVMAIGNPLGFTGALSTGIVRALPGSFQMGMYRWICAEVRLAPGNSGGPLADLQGRVVGLNTMVIRGNLALAVPSRAIQGFIAGDDRGAKLGVTLRAVTLRSGGAGMMILELETGGAADRASLLPGDILLAGNGRKLQFIDDLQAALHGAGGSLLVVDFCRGGEGRRRQVTVQLRQERASAA